MVLNYEETLAKVKGRVLGKLDKYLADKDFTDGQKILMLRDIEREIDEAY